jgi:probable rRNA maturation factor
VDSDQCFTPPNNKVWVEFAEPTNNLDAKQVSAWVRAACTQHSGTVSVRFVGEDEGRSLHGQFRKVFRATNVLAFPAHETNILGDIAVCVPVANKEALDQGKSLTSHLAHLVVHGTLHLCDYDHERAEDAHLMEAKEIQILRTFGFDDPYTQNG